MSIDAASLAALLPAIHRTRDAAAGGPLDALLGLMAREAEIVRADIDQLYESWFIETCPEWVVPYIADLLGLTGYATLRPESGVSLRAFVANTLRYRRRKGTPAVLEAIARDLTGRPAAVAEYFERLGWTANVNHPRLHAPSTADLRRQVPLQGMGGPFDRLARTVDVRGIDQRPGRDRHRGLHAVPHVGLHLFRDIVAPLAAMQATPAAGQPGCWHMRPPEIAAPLHNLGRAETEAEQFARAPDLPAPLEPLALHAELEAWRAALAAGETPRLDWWAGDRAPFAVAWRNAAGDAWTSVPAEEIAIAVLDPWRRPKPSRDYPGGAGMVPMPITCAVDPRSGRVAFAEGFDPVEVRTSFGQGAAGPLGAGPWDRRDSIAALLRDAPAGLWQIGVAREPPPGSGRILPGLQAALDAFALEGAGRVGLIALMDNALHDGPFDVVLPPDSRLLILAADWPAVPDPTGALPPQRRGGQVAAVGRVATLRGALRVAGTADRPEASRGLVLEGLQLLGPIAVDCPGLDSLELGHLSLRPEGGGLGVTDAAPALRLAARRCLLGPLALPGQEATLVLEECVIAAAAPNGLAINAPLGALSATWLTVLDRADLRALNASDSLFARAVRAARRQEGCVRFSYLAPGSQAPRRFRCQPDLAVEAGGAAVAVTPVFVTRRFGAAGFGALHPSAAVELRTGGEDGSAMGGFGALQEARREDNLRRALQDFLPVGLAAGLIPAGGA